MIPALYPLIFQTYLLFSNNFPNIRATGCSLNINKTEGLLIQTNRVFYNNNKFLIKWKITDFVKILGIHFNNDIEMTNRYNIIKCIQKMENNVKLQNQRHLSLKGKTIIINTILLSKLWYICSVFPLPKNLIPEINKIIFKFLWNNKNPEPIARETLFLPRERGGLGILVPSIESQALRIKYLIKLGTKLKLTKKYIKEIKNKLITTKNIYNTIVNNATKNCLLASEARWNVINKQGLDWKQIWINAFNAYNIPYENNLYYKILHRIIYVNQKTYDNAKQKNNKSPLCDICQKANETIIHAFYECKSRKKYGKHLNH